MVEQRVELAHKVVVEFEVAVTQELEVLHEEGLFADEVLLQGYRISLGGGNCTYHDHFHHNCSI